MSKELSVLYICSVRLSLFPHSSYNYGASQGNMSMEVQSSKESVAGTCCDSVATGTVERVAVANLPTEWGDFQIAAYRSLTTDEEFVVLFKGEMKRDVPA